MYELSFDSSLSRWMRSPQRGPIWWVTCTSEASAPNCLSCRGTKRPADNWRYVLTPDSTGCVCVLKQIHCMFASCSAVCQHLPAAFRLRVRAQQHTWTATLCSIIRQIWRPCLSAAEASRSPELRLGRNATQPQPVEAHTLTKYRSGATAHACGGISGSDTRKHDMRLTYNPHFSCNCVLLCMCIIRSFWC